MSSVNLTRTFISSLADVTDVDTSYSDAKTAGLVLRHRGRAKSFVFRSSFAGKSLSITLGKWPDTTVDDARRQALWCSACINKGVDPRTADKKASNPSQYTVGDLWATYRTERESRFKQNTINDLERLAKRHREFLGTPLHQLDEGRVERYFVSLTAPAQANQFMRFLRAVINWGMEDRRFAPAVAANPVLVLNRKRLWHRDKARTTVLEQSDLGRFREVLAGLDEPIRDWMWLMLLTGCRKGELDNMQVDYRRGTVTFLDTKTHTDRVIPLTSQVRSILERGKWQLKPTNVRYQLKIVEEGLGFRLTAHDLRRSFATLSEWCEIPEGVVRQMMGHTGRGSHERNYRHRSVDLLRKFMERYNDWLVGEDGGFVVD